MTEVEEGIEEFTKEYGVSSLEHIILTDKEYDIYGLTLKQKYPHIIFERGGDVRVFIHR